MSRPSAKQKAIAYQYAKKAGLKVSPPKVAGYGAYHPKKRLPTRPKARGMGAYKSNYGERLGGVLGEGAERIFDAVMPGGLGGIAKILGFGAYVQPTFKVRANTLVDGLNGGNDPPEVQNARDGRVIIRHREYLRDVITGNAGTFNVDSFPINPGQQQVFPWLAQVAQAFEQYRLRGMIFEFKSTSADSLNSTNTALGSVIMATEYDSARPDFTSKMQMENHQYASSARMSCSMYHPIECDRSQTPITELYVRTSSVADSNDNDTDLRLMDWGKFQIATFGQQANTVNIGELWVTYEIELLKPCMNETGAIQQADYYESIDGSYLNTLFFGNPATRRLSTANNAGLTLTANRITWPKGATGKWIVCLEWVGSGAAAVTMPTVTFGAAIQGTDNSTSPFNTALSAPTAGQTSSRLFGCWMIEVLGQSSSTGVAPYFDLTSGSGTLPNTPTTVKIYVASVYDKITLLSVQPPGPDPLEAIGDGTTMDDEFKNYIRSQMDNLRYHYEESKVKVEEVKEVSEEALVQRFADLNSSQLLELLDKAKAIRKKKEETK